MSREYPNDWVLGADTIVVIDQEILGKPETQQEAWRMLTKLSDREHTVFTGYTISKDAEGVTISDVVKSKVLIKNITAEEMAGMFKQMNPMIRQGATRCKDGEHFLSGRFTDPIPMSWACLSVKSLIF